MKKMSLDELIELEISKDNSYISVWEVAEHHASNHSGRLDAIANWLYNGELGKIIANADSEMIDIILTMLREYHIHGEGDQYFMSYAGDVNRRRWSEVNGQGKQP